MTAPVFVVDSLRPQDLPAGEYVLDGPEGRHAVSVKRLRAVRTSSSPTGAATGPRAR